LCRSRSHEPCSASERIGDNGKAEAAAVSQAAATAGGASATAAGPLRSIHGAARVAMDAGDRMKLGACLVCATLDYMLIICPKTRPQ